MRARSSMPARPWCRSTPGSSTGGRGSSPRSSRHSPRGSRLVRYNYSADTNKGKSSHCYTATLSAAASRQHLPMNDAFRTGAARAQLELGFGFGFHDLYSTDGLRRLDSAFLDALGGADAALRARLEAGRADPAALARKAESELLIALGPHLEDFCARLFGIEAEVRALAARHRTLAPVYACKRQFVQRKAMTAFRPEQAAGFDGAALEARLVGWFSEPFSELAFARHVQRWQEDEAGQAERLDTAMRYAAWAAHTPAGRERHRAGVLFKTPHKLDFYKLVAL